RAAPDPVVVDLVLERVAGAAGTGAAGTAGLDHEVRNHAVEDQAVVEPVRRELGEVLDRPGGVVLKKLELDVSEPGRDACAGVCHGWQPTRPRRAAPAARP